MACQRLTDRAGRLALIGLLVLVAAPSCKLSLTDAPLGPARDLVGTWTTSAPVTFRMQTDFCGDVREDVSQSNWNVTWIITKVPSDPNKVDIEMHYTAGGAQRVQSSCGNGGTGYVPLVSPQFLEGNISSSALHVDGDVAFTGSFTTDLIQGTWNHWECLIYCFGETTGTNQLKFVKQH